MDELPFEGKEKPAGSDKTKQRGHIEVGITVGAPGSVHQSVAEGGELHQGEPEVSNSLINRFAFQGVCRSNPSKYF